MELIPGYRKKFSSTLNLSHSRIVLRYILHSVNFSPNIVRKIEITIQLIFSDILISRENITSLQLTANK